jgi:Ser/Thr protein kinase RdoA (MazF antagonist)
VRHETLTAAALRFTPPELAPEPLAAALTERWGIEGELKALRGERDQNFRVTSARGERYVLKIASPSEDAELIDFQVGALQHVADAGLPVPRQVLSRQGNAIEHIDVGDTTYAARLLTWIPGVPMMTQAPPSPDTLHDIGRLQGRLCRALQGYEHPAESHFMPWNILNGLIVSRDLRENYMRADVAARCAGALDRLEHDSLPAIRGLPGQVIHNDAHSGNVMCDPDDPATVTGLIDFGDLVRGPKVVDLATSVCSYIEHRVDLLAVVAALVQGYREHADIGEDELGLLYDAVLARSILTVQLLTFRVANDCASDETRDVGLPTCIDTLDALLATDPGKFFEAIS